MAGKAVIALTSANFDREVLQSDVPVLVDFWASWCGPCKMIAPFIDELAEAYQGKAKVCKVNVDDAGDLAIRFGVVSIPTVMVFKNGALFEQATGAYPKAHFEGMLQKAL